MIRAIRKNIAAGDAFWLRSWVCGIDMDVHHLATLPADCRPDRDCRNDADANPAGRRQLKNISAVTTR